MATELAKAYVQIIPSAKGIKGQLSNALGGEAGSAGTSAGNIAGNNLASKIKTVVATAGIGAVLKAALSEGADLQQSLGGIETLFKDSSNKVISNAKNAYKTAGMSANEYMETVTSFSASLLQGLSGDTNKAADVADMALTDMSDNANKMGTSMELIQNAYQGFSKQNYTMLDNLKLGYGGTKTEMERLLADATELSGVKYDISNLSDVYEAIHVIQDEMGITGTTADEAAKTFSGSLASMKAAATNVLGNLALGEDIGPSLTALSETVFIFVKDNLFPMLGNVLSSLPEVLNSAVSMAVRGLNLAADGADTFVQNGVDLIKELVVGIVSAIPYLLESAGKLVVALATALINTDWIQVATDVITQIRDNLGVAAGEILGTDGNIIDSLLTSITNGLPLVLEKGVELISKIVEGILSYYPQYLTTFGELVKKAINFIADNLPSFLQAGVSLVSELINGVVQHLPNILATFWSLVIDILATIGQKLPDILQMGITLLGELAAGIIKAIPKLISQIPTIITKIKDKFAEFDWLEIGKNILKGIANGIKNAGSLIIDAAKEAAKGALDAAKEFLGIHSPSRVFEAEVGKMMDLGMAAGIKNNIGAVADSMKELSSEAVGMIDTDLSIQNSGFNSQSDDNSILSGMSQILALLIQYLPQLANMKVVTDTGTIIGELLPGIDSGLGMISNLKDRGN